MLPRPLRAAAAAAAAALLLALTPSPAIAAAPSKEAPAAAKKKDAGDKAAKKDAADKKGAVAKKDAADKKGAVAKKDATDKKDADKGDKKDAATKAKVAKKDEPKDPKKDGKGASSIGAPNKGKLAGALKLRPSRALKIKQRATTWALPDLVKLLQRAAGKVAKKHPRSVLLVGDLSQKNGGPMLGHNSHQTGRDADVGFYVANSKGKPAAMTRFVAFDGAGKSSQVTWAQFDDARNWALVEALLTDKDAPARYIFVSNPLRLRLLAYAAKKKVAKDLQTKAAFAMLSPRDADVHDDHFHVRIGCPESMRGTCHEESLARSPVTMGPQAAPNPGAPGARTPPAPAAGSAPVASASAGDAKTPAAIAKPDAAPAPVPSAADSTYE